MIRCPCCSNQLLRHTRGAKIYWFCRNCWQEMPEPKPGKRRTSSSNILVEVSDRLPVDVNWDNSKS